MKHIKLTQGKFAIVDNELFRSLNQFKWCAMKTRYGGFLATRSAPITNKTIYMHRIIAKAPKGLDIDHHNHNTLDNRKNNLRRCSRAQNKQNGNPYKNHSSAFKGVHCYKQGTKWQASIRNNGQKIHLGYFDDEIEAAKVYDAKAKELFGEFAYPNF